MKRMQLLYLSSIPRFRICWWGNWIVWIAWFLGSNLSLSQTLKLYVYRRHSFQPQRKYKTTLECRLEETTWKRAFCMNSSVSLHNSIHPRWETWTNYLTFAYKLHILGVCGTVPCVILSQFLNLSKSPLPCLQNRLILVMQDGVRLN